MEKPKNDTDSEEDDDMKKIIYEGKTYYIHEGKDVTDDEYEIVGEWLQEEKRIKFFDKNEEDVVKKEDVENKPNDDVENKPKDEVENKPKDEPNLDIKDRYKEKVVVKKLDGKIESEEVDDDSDLDLNLEDNDDIMDNKDDKILDDEILSDDEDIDIKKIGGYNVNDSANDSANDSSDSDNDSDNNYDNDNDSNILDGGKIKKVVKQIKNIKPKQDIKIKTEKISVLNGKYNNLIGITFF